VIFHRHTNSEKNGNRNKATGEIFMGESRVGKYDDHGQIITISGRHGAKKST